MLACLCAALAFWNIFAQSLFFFPSGFWQNIFRGQRNDLILFVEFHSHQKDYFPSNVMKTSLQPQLARWEGLSTYWSINDYKLTLPFKLVFCLLIV